MKVRIKVNLNNSFFNGSWLMCYLAALNTPGGHIAICLSLLLWFGHAQGLGLPHDISVFALGVLSRSMGVTQTAATYAPPPTEASHVETTTTAEVSK